MSSEEVIRAYARLNSNNRGDSEAAAIVEANWKLVVDEILLSGSETYQLSSYATRRTLKHLSTNVQVLIAQRLHEKGVPDAHARVAKNAPDNPSVQMFESAFAVAAESAMGCIIMYAGFFHSVITEEDQDCIDWILDHFGDNRSLMRYIFKYVDEKVCDLFIKHDPTLLETCGNWTYATDDVAVIGLAILYGYAAKLTPRTLSYVDGIHKYREEARLDEYLRVSDKVPIWLALELGHHYEPFELARFPPYKETVLTYLAQQTPEYVRQYRYYCQLNRY
jgi:hypothetical protein